LAVLEQLWGWQASMSAGKDHTMKFDFAGWHIRQEWQYYITKDMKQQHQAAAVTAPWIPADKTAGTQCHQVNFAAAALTRPLLILLATLLMLHMQTASPSVHGRAPVQLALLLSHTQPDEQLQAYPVEGAGRSTHDPLTAWAWLLQGLPWQASRSAGGSGSKYHRALSKC
jgi:hypothetical protein